MTWQELHERMDFMAEVIGRANENPESAIDFGGELAARLPGLRALLDETTRRSVRVRGRHHDDVPVELHSGALQRQTVA